MAVDLAKLVARLELQSGQFQSELAQANKKLSRFDTDVRKVGQRLTRGFKGLLAGFTVGAALNKIRTETSAAEASFAQLDAVVKSTGGAAGFTTQELAGMAQRLQGLTTYGDDAAMAMQSVLLTFTKIRGPEFQGAQLAILNMATRLGTDLKSAAIQVGKALNDPIKGVASLGKAGVQFSASQKALIKDLTEAGRVADAQKLILAELEVQFGGAAAAAKNTLGGALKSLGNAFGDLFELTGKSSESSVKAINDLTTTLQEPATKEALASLTSGFATLFSVIIKGAAKAVNGLTALPEVMGQAARAQAQTGVMRFGNEAMRDNAMLRAQGLGGGSGGRGGRRNPRGTAGTGAAVADIAADVETLESALQEFEVQVARIKSDPLAEYFEQLNDSTKTDTEQTIDQIDRLLATVQALQREGIIGAELAQKRISEGLDQLLPAFDIAAIRAKRITIEKEVKALNEFEIAAARETQGVIASSIKDAFTGSFDEIPKRFADMLLDLVIQAQAAKLATYLFGDTGSGGSTGGVLSGLASAFFGGGKAMGGAVYPGQAYLVGERGPEMFVPPSAGRIEANRGGGGNTVINVNVRAEGGEVSRPTRLALGATVARTLGRANVRNN
jgi:hypothetical protein